MIVLDISNPKNTNIIAADGSDTNVSVQDLINSLCNALDGTEDYDLENMIGSAEIAEKIAEVRSKVKHLWTHEDGTRVLG